MDFSGIAVVADPFMPEGYIALVSNGKPVWLGLIDAPIEDAEADKAFVSLSDYERIRNAALPR